MKIKFHKTIVVLLLLLVGLLNQPVSTIGSNPEPMGNHVTNGEPLINTMSPEISNDMGMIPAINDPLEGVNNNWQSPFVNPITNRPTSFVSQVDVEQSTPEGIITWGSIANKLDANPSPYTTIKENALIKVFDTNLVEAIVKVDSMTLTNEIDAFFALHNVQIVGDYPMLAIYVVLIDANVLETFMNEASAIQGISYVQPNYYYNASFVPNDTEWSNQYGPQIIGMEYAWDVQMGDIDVVVAIIDTGIDYTHPDLGNYLPIGYDWYNNDPDPFDDNGHGTHVAGTVAGTINNALGIAGVANVSFFAEKFLDEFGFGSDIGGANAIIHAVDMGADILSNSWGGYGESQVLEDAVNYAISNGVIVVAAAGNDNIDQLHYPSAYPEVIAVAGTDEFDNRYTSSNFGPWVDIAAPGVNVLSTVPWGYDYFTGTSMATPHVSGLLALLQSQYPSYDPLQLENLLYTTAVDLGDPGFDDYFGWGRIDAATAIIGLQDHSLRAAVVAPATIPGDMTTTISGKVMNLGLMNETNVDISMSINDVVVASEVLPQLFSGQSYEIYYDFTPQFYGFYNISVNVVPVPGEELLADNYDLRVVEVTPQIIDPQVGDIMGYGPMNGDTPFQIRWNVIDTSNPLEYIMDLWVFEPEFNEEFLADTFVLNPFTREFSSIYFPETGVLWPYMFQTDIQIGDRFDFFTLGAQDGYVVDEGFVEYYGEIIPVWIVDEGFEFALISKTDGVLVALRDYNFNPIIYDLVFNNVLFETSNLHNMRSKFSGPVNVQVDVPSDINVFVQNTGAFFEATQLLLTIENETIGLIDVYLNASEYMYLSFTWTPPALGQYYAVVDVFPVFDEFYYDDNFDDKVITVAELENYNLSFPTFSWFDAASNGINLNFFGDDVSTPVNLPFSFQFYDQSFDTVYVSSNGWMSFADSNPYQLYYPGFPTNEFPYAVALFLSDLMAENNVYLWSTSEFVAIEYNNYNYLSSELAGTFEVVFFATGEILFQYQYVNVENGQIGKGLNHGVNLNFYTVLTDNLSGRSDFAALFSTEPVSAETDVAAGLNIPNNLEAGQLGFIEAFVQNTGIVDAEFVELSLFIDGELVATTFTEFLLAGDTLSLGHYWVPPFNGQFLVEAVVTPVSGEANLDNNHYSEFAIVGAIHDLVVFLDINFEGGRYLVDGTVLNAGETDESNVIVQIFISGQEVALGEIETLKVGRSYTIRHYWDPNGPAEVAVFAPYLENEKNFDNNLVIQFFEPVASGTIAVQVLDMLTMDPILDAEIYIYNPDYFQFGLTNWSGGYQTSVPLGDYTVDIVKDGYLMQSFYVVLTNPDDFVTIFAYLDPISTGETGYLELQVVDVNTNVGIEFVEILIVGGLFNFTDFTDVNGYFFSELPLDFYYIEVYKEGYHPQSFFVELLNPGEFIGIYVTLEPLLTDYTQLDINVYDLFTDEPIAFAEIYISNPIYFEYGQTNSTGTYVSLLPIGEYWIEVFTDGYFRHSFSFIVNDPVLNVAFVYLEPYGDLAPVIVQIQDVETDEPIQDVEVHIYGTADAWGFTNASGSFYAEMPAGYYGIDIFKFGYVGINTDLVIDNTDQTYLILIYLEPLGELIDFVIQIDDIATGLPVEGVWMNINGPMSAYGQTNLTGTFQTQLALGNYFIDLAKEGYIHQNFEIVIDDPNQLYFLQVFLEPLGELAQVDINVADMMTGQPLEGVEIILSSPSVFDIGMTDTNGTYTTFVPLGEYFVNIVKGGYFSQDFMVLFEDPVYNVIFVQLEPLGELAQLDVNVYDLDTGLPIEFAEMYISNPSYFEPGFTNVTGTYATFVPLGYYYIDVFKEGYLSGYTEISIDDPNQIYSVFIYLEAISSETATVEVLVLDDSTGLPIEFAYVYIGNSGITFQGETDVNGLFIADVALGEYSLSVDNFGYYYYTEQIMIDVANGYYQFLVLLIPEGSALGFNIISPTDNELVDGALVSVFFDVDNPFELMFMDVYVNDQYITTVDFLVDNNIFVPVFEEGYNNITLMVQWGNGQQAWASVLIESVNLVPYMIPEIGDILHWTFTVDIVPILTVEFNFTVVDWMSPNEVLFDLVIRQYDETGTILLENHYVVVNVLNGYVSNSDMSWLYQHFYFFSGLVSPSNANVGDTFPFWSWGEVLTITGTTTWNGFDAWIFDNTFGLTIGSVLKDNGLFVYYSQDNDRIVGEMIDTSFFPQGTIPPTVSDTEDLTLEFGGTSISISWIVNSENPDFYVILLDGNEIELGLWNDGDIITVLLDDLQAGYYLYEIIVFDTNGESGYDSVLVSVLDTVAPTIDGPDGLTIEHGTAGNNITWYLYDLDPLNYTVLVDWEFIETGDWSNSVPIVIDLDGLSPGTYEFYIEVFDGSYNLATAIVTVIVHDTTPPSLSSPDDISFGYGETGHIITWVISDSNPENYSVYQDGIIVDENNYNFDDNVEITLDGLVPGIYVFEIFVLDQYGNFALDIVVVEITDVEPPTVRGEVDFTYELGSTDNYVSWTVSNDPNGTYQIYRDGLLIDEGFWVDGDAIEINIDGLMKGRYNYTAVFTDSYGNSKADTVIVYVIPEIDSDNPPRRLPGFEIWLSLISLFGLIFIRRKRSLSH